MEKMCTVCKITKPLDGFYRTKHGLYGRESRCIPCFKQLNKVARQKHMQAHPEVWRERNAKKRAGLTPEQLSEYRRRYRERHPEKVSEANRLARAKSPEKYREQRKRWQNQNPEKWAAILNNAQHRHRANKLEAEVSDFTWQDWQELKVQYQGRCAYCGIKPKILTQDHVIPLARGGNHTKANIVPACVPCNSKKNVNPAPPFHPDFT